MIFACAGQLPDHKTKISEISLTKIEKLRTVFSVDSKVYRLRALSSHKNMESIDINRLSSHSVTKILPIRIVHTIEDRLLRNSNISVALIRNKVVEDHLT